MNHRFECIFRIAKIMTVLMVTFIVACSENPDGGSPSGLNGGTTEQIEVPRRILEARNVDLDDIRLEATVYGANSGTVEMDTERNGSTWIATVELEKSDSYTYSLTWYHSGFGVPLARTSETTASTSLTFSSSDYNYDLDYDGDGASNLIEIQVGTNPTAFDSQDACNWPSCDVIIPRVSEAPVIDGLDNDSIWGRAVERDLNGDFLYIHNLLVDNKSHTDQAPVHRWKAMHDGEYLYLWVEYTDTYLVYDSPLLDPWQDDSIDVLFDGNNSKNTPYDYDDYHIIIPFDDGNNEELAGESGFFDYGNNSNALGSTGWPEISWATRYGVKTASNDLDLATFEMRFELDNIGLAVGRVFGFEVQHNDDDDGGDRDAKWGWHHPSGSDRGNRDTSVFGTAVLEIW